ncbi:MAG: hypothetical protein NTY96_05925 [Bacteroidetes bacterium]|nr:hypothetical protein [Bacteroidota bacterium]
MKKIKFFFLTFIVALIVNSMAFSQDYKTATTALSHAGDARNIFKPLSQDPEAGSILKITENQINSFIETIPGNSLANYGFNSREELQKITFDTPVRVYTLKDSNIVFTSTWRVPVVVDKEYRALLTIIKVNEEYTLTDFGARVLARELFAKKSDHTCGLLRVYELRSDYLIEASSGNQVKFIPIQGSKDKLFDLHDIFNMIKNK